MFNNQNHKFAIQITTNVGLKCQICEAQSIEMRELVPLNDPHKDMASVCSSQRCIVYVCEECPCVILEYYGSEQIKALEKLLDYNVQETLTIINPHENNLLENDYQALELKFKSKSISGYNLHSPRMSPCYVREVGEIIYEGKTQDGHNVEAIFKTGLDNVFGNSHEFSPSSRYSCEAFKLNQGVTIKPDLIVPNSPLYLTYKEVLEAIDIVESSLDLEYNRSVKAYKYFLNNHNETYTYEELVDLRMIYSHIQINAVPITHDQ